MKKVERGILSKYQIYSFTSMQDEKNVDHILGTDTIERTIQMAKDAFISEFKKLKYNGDRMVIHMDSGYDVTLYIDRDYSGYGEIDSKTYTQFLSTDCGDRCIKTRKRTYKNPEYDGNPECQFCNKRVVKLIAQKNAVGTVLMVCTKCKKTLQIVVNFHNKWEKTHGGSK